MYRSRPQERGRVMARKPPRLMVSSLTDRVYIVTAYKEMENGLIVSNTKFDVTDEFTAIVAQRGLLGLLGAKDEAMPQ